MGSVGVLMEEIGTNTVDSCDGMNIFDLDFRSLSSSVIIDRSVFFQEEVTVERKPATVNDCLRICNCTGNECAHT